MDIFNRLKQILSNQQKKRILALLIMMIIGAGLETLGVSLILPLISAIMDPESISNNSLIQYISKIFDLRKTNSILLFIIISLIIVYIIKNLYLLFMYYVQYRFIYNNQFRTSQKLFHVYLHRPYNYFLNINSSVIMRIISTDVSNMYLLLLNVLQLFTEVVVFIFLAVFLFFVDPLMTVSIALILGIAVLVISKILKPTLKSSGEEVQEYSSLMNKWLLQSITGIKELKVAQSEDFFQNQYSDNGEKYVHAIKHYNILANSPRLLIETLCIVSMLSLLAFMLVTGKDVSQMLPQVSAFAVAAIRLMPCANRINTYINAISYYQPSLEQVSINGDDQLQVKRDVKYDDMGKEVNITLNKELQINDINFMYPGSTIPIFDNASMVIPAGKSVAIVGTSGAGKTTIIDVLLGLLEVQSGSIESDGINIFDNYKQWLGNLGYIPQTIFLLDDTIRANIAFGVDQDKISDERIWDVLEEAQLSEVIRNMPDGLETVVGERGVRLSGGQRQRLSIARALYSDPDLLIFDEATSALDNTTESAIMDSIQRFKGSKTIIIIAHRIGTIKDCDIVYRVENKKIIRER